MRTHLITNFPLNYPLYKKVGANIVYFVTGITTQPRKNLLSKQDIIKARLRLRRGDIILLGNLHELSSTVIGGTLTHATLYAGRKRCIEAVGAGVRYASLAHVFTSYDTLAILRIPRAMSRRRTIIRHAIRYAKQQLGKAYDFDFTSTRQGFFCSKLVNEAFRAAGYKTRLKSSSRPRSLLAKFLSKISRAITALRPARFVYGNFEVVFLSHNLTLKGKRIILKEG